MGYLGHDALGHSHLTDCNAGRLSLHLLDRPPSLYEINVAPDSPTVNKIRPLVNRRTTRQE